VNLNKAFILGNVTRTPEAKALPSGLSVVNFGVATNRFYTDKTGTKKQDAEFHNVVAFGKLADICSSYLNKGSLVLIEGRIQTRNWLNSSGVKQYRTEIVASNIQLAPKSMSGPTSGSMPASGIGEKNEEIPIIEENYIPPSVDNLNQPQSAELPDEQEIDVKDIPF